MVSRVVRTGGGYANHVNVAGGEVDASDDLMSALFGKDNHSLGSATAGRSSKKGVKKLRREWQACPGGLSFIGEEGEGVAEKVTAVGKMATRGGNSFANNVHVSEGKTFWHSASHRKCTKHEFRVYFPYIEPSFLNLDGIFFDELCEKGGVLKAMGMFSQRVWL
jgi:hypothetical protein